MKTPIFILINTLVLSVVLFIQSLQLKENSEDILRLEMTVEEVVSQKRTEMDVFKAKPYWQAESLWHEIMALRDQYKKDTAKSCNPCNNPIRRIRGY